MATSYKNIVITPNIGNTADPKIQFSGGNTTSNTDVNLFVYPDANGTLSFEGSAGQLFSITNDLSNSIFSVNDVSGIPAIEVFANGLINIAQFGGNVAFGNTSKIIIPSGTGLYVNGTYGTAGHVLHSNGSALYWAADDQGVTQVNTGIGLSGGPITTTGTVSVLANSGIVANSTGIFVNANSGLIANSTGVFVNANSGLIANSTGVFVNANNGTVANTSGLFVRAGNNVTVNSTGVHVNAAAIPSVTASIQYIISGDGDTIGTGVAGLGVRLPYPCTITGVTLLGDRVGNLVVDIWRSSYANYPPVVANTITASAKPTLANTNKYEDNTLTGWTTAIANGDILFFNVDSAANVQLATVILRITK